MSGSESGRGRACLILSDAQRGDNPHAEIQGDNDIFVIAALTQNFDRDILIQTKKQTVKFSSVLNDLISNKTAIFAPMPQPQLFLIRYSRSLRFPSNCHV